MSSQRKFMLIICFVFIDILLILSIVFVSNVTLTALLEKEINSLTSLNFTIDRFNSNIKTIGNYGKVETAIKSYLDDYSSQVKNLLDNIDYNRLDTFSSIEYLSNSSSFATDLLYLSQFKNDFNSNVNSVINKNNKSIYSYVYNYIDDDYFVRLYNELIDENIIKIIDSNNNGLKYKKTLVNAYVDSIYNYISFLNRNSNNFSVVDGNIRFCNKDLEIEYFDLIQKIKESKV